MGTSRSDPLDGLRFSEAATEEEAAALAAAIGTYLANERVAVDETERRPWAGRRWAFAGRLGSLGLESGRVPDGAPDSGWAAVGRADRF